MKRLYGLWKSRYFRHGISHLKTTRHMKFHNDKYTSRKKQISMYRQLVKTLFLIQSQYSIITQDRITNTSTVFNLEGSND